MLVVTEEAAAGGFVSREGEGIERRGEGEGMEVTASFGASRVSCPFIIIIIIIIIITYLI